MGATMRVPTEFTAVDKFTSVVAKMTSGVSNFTKSTASAVSRVNTKINNVFKGLDGVSQAFLGLGAAGIAAFSGKSIMDYETALHSLQAVTGVTSDKFKGQIESIAKSSNKSAIDVAKSFEIVGSAMSEYLNDPKALGKITNASIILSKASGDELEPSIDNLTSIMNQFSMGADKALFAVNRLTAGEIVGSVRTSRLAQEMKDVGGIAYFNGIQLGEMTAAMEVMGKRIPHDQLGRVSRNLVTFMSTAKAAPKAAIASMERLGVSTDILMNKNISFERRLKELSKAKGDAIAMEALFGKENISGATQLLNNIKLYHDWNNQIANTNKAQEQAATNSKTLASAFDAIKNQFINTIVSGDKLSPSLERIKDIAFWIAKNMDTIVDVITKVVTAFLAFKTINTIIELATGIMAGYTFVVGLYEGVALTAALTGASFASVIWSTVAPILAVIAAVVAIVAIFYYWNDIMGWFSKQWAKFTNFIGTLWDGLVNWFKGFSFKDFFMGIGQSIIDFLLFPLKSVLQLVSLLPGALGKAAKSGLSDINNLTNLNQLGLNVNEPKRQDSPEKMNQKIMQQNTLNGGLNVNFNDRNKEIKSINQFGNNAIPVKVTTTQGSN